MSISPRTFSNLQTPTEPSDAADSPLVVVPWSKFGTRRLYVDTPDGRHVGWVDLNTGHRSLAMPELAPSFMIAISEAEDALPPRRALDEAIESALIAGQAALHASESTPASTPQDRPEPQLGASVPAGHRADEPTTTMRRAYRGKQAFSSWEVGARGKRLVADDLDRPAPMDPRLAYLNSTSVQHDAQVAHLFA